MLQHKQGVDYEGKIKNALKERMNTVEYKQKDISERIIVELSSAGLFASLKPSEINNLVNRIVAHHPIEADYEIVKMECLDGLSKLYKDKQQKRKVTVQIPLLLAIREQAQKKKKHPYEDLKEKEYIKDPLMEFYG